MLSCAWTEDANLWSSAARAKLRRDSSETDETTRNEPAPSLPVPPPADPTPIEPTGQLPDDPTKPPPGYGQIRPPLSLPDVSTLTHHALAGYEVVAIYGRPDLSSEKLGYLRLGARLRVGPKIDGQGCPTGFHAIAQGGFACTNKGLVVDPERPPYMKQVPPPPRLETPLPYDYAYVSKWNAPMWWRIPTEQELVEMNRQRAMREAQRLAAEKIAKGEVELTGPSLPGPIRVPTLALPGLHEAEPDAAGPDDKVEPVTPARIDGKPKTESSTLPSAASDTRIGVEQAEPIIKLPLNPERPWLERGFFISLGEVVRESGRSYWNTARGAYVWQGDTIRHQAKDFIGVVLGENVQYPFGWVATKEAKLFEPTPNGRLRMVKVVERRTFLDLNDEVVVNGKTYMSTSDGLLVEDNRVVVPDLQDLPDGLDTWDRWIDVSLEKQLLMAYEGTRPVYATLISTGKKGTEEDPFETPAGRYRIYSKQVSSNMDGNTASDGNYSIQDVPWTMFFEGSYALHGAFWHRGFGSVRSHGCVNLGPSDARWLFFWTTPFLPDGWHGVHATEESPGTTVIVRL